jgi:hypothetical protein
MEIVFLTKQKMRMKGPGGGEKNDNDWLGPSACVECGGQTPEGCRHRFGLAATRAPYLALWSCQSKAPSIGFAMLRRGRAVEGSLGPARYSLFVGVSDNISLVP